MSKRHGFPSFVSIVDGQILYLPTVNIRFELFVCTSFFRHAVLTKSFGGVTFVGVVTGTVLVVHALTSSSTCLLRLSSVLFTNKVNSGRLAARSAKLRNLRVISLYRSISFNLGFSIIFRPWLSCTVSLRAPRVHRFSIYCDEREI